jgi:hypothetical protein
MYRNDMKYTIMGGVKFPLQFLEEPLVELRANRENSLLLGEAAVLNTYGLLG